MAKNVTLTTQIHDIIKFLLIYEVHEFYENSSVGTVTVVPIGNSCYGNSYKSKLVTIYQHYS